MVTRRDMVFDADFDYLRNGADLKSPSEESSSRIGNGSMVTAVDGAFEAHRSGHEAAGALLTSIVLRTGHAVTQKERRKKLKKVAQY